MTTHARPPEDVPLNRWGFIPPWAPLLIMAAVVFTGIVLGKVGSVLLILFFLSCIVCTALVELRGLFLTVVAIPLYWFIGIGLIGYVTDPNSFSGSSRKTAVITAAYPAVENYLWLVATFLVSLLIALVRQRLDAAARERAQRIAQQRRRQIAAAEEDNRRVTSRVRSLERTGGRRRAEDHEDRPDRPARGYTAERGTATTYGSTRHPAPQRSGDQESYQAPRAVTRPRRTTSPGEEDVRTRTAAELRAASERRRSREESSYTARHRSPDSPLDFH